MCKKQSSVSQISTESEVISLDAGLRMDGIPALDPWDVVIEVFHSSNNTHKYTLTSSDLLLPRNLVSWSWSQIPTQIRGGSTEIPSHTCCEPKMSLEEAWQESWDRSLSKAGKNSGRSLSNYVQSRIHSEKDSAESITDSDFEDGESRKMLSSPLHVHGRAEKLWFSSKTHSFRETGSRSNTEVKGKCTTYSSWSLKMRELEVKFISRASSVCETGCSVIKERQTWKPVQKFVFFFLKKYAAPSKLGRTLLEGSTDHLLLQARSKLMKQEHQVGSFNSCINEVQQQAYAQGLELQDARNGYLQSRREQARP